MKIFLAGATGALGKRLVPILIAAGHSVAGMTRTAAKADSLRAAGADPVIADALDAEAVRDVVMRARPDVVVHQVTSLAGIRSLRNFDKVFAATNRLRTEGTRNLLAAAQSAGANRFIAQSYTGWPNERTGARIKTESDPLDSHPPDSMRQTLEAIRQLEQMVLGATGLTGSVLRYGSFYGPGTSLGQSGEMTEMVRGGKFPIVGDGAGIWSFIHIDDAAQATRLAIERGPAGVFNIVDDEPAEVATWLPDLARALGAQPPRHVPAWLGKLLIGEAAFVMMTQACGSSNALAKQALGWRPAYTSWRDGFRRGLPAATPILRAHHSSGS